MIEPRDQEAATAAAACVVTIHRRLVEELRPGLTLAHIDAFIAAQLQDLGCTSCFKGYKVRGHPPFPSHSCLSVNDCVVHGTHDMSDRPIAEGDLLSVDIGVKHKGWIGDAAWTYSFGEPDKLTRALMESGKESLRRGIAAMEGLDGWVMPTVPEFAQPVADFPTVERVHWWNGRVNDATRLANYLGQCGISLPLPADEPGALPAGLQLVCAPGADRALLAIAMAVESVIGPGDAPDLAGFC